jgi:transcriptional antiterminator RfaH
MPYWACAQLEPNRERLAAHFLGLAGFEVYRPLLRTRRISRGRRVAVVHALFPCYAFVWIQLQWHAARWCPGVVRLVTAGGVVPAAVPDSVIGALRAREVGGLIELPRREEFRMGEAVRVTAGPFSGRLAIYDGMSGAERVTVLLSLLGGERRLTLRAGDIEAV